MGQHSAEETRDAVAKVGFAAVMAAAMGPVGILIAALAVGVEQAWNGDAGRPVSEDLNRDRVEQERQWLAEDRAWRHAQRAARQRWLDDGAKPDLEPGRPSKAEAAGRFWRRVWARMVVWSDDFKRGFRDGWHAAAKAREDGAGWLETARTRPDRPVDPRSSEADPTTPAEPGLEPEVEPVGVDYDPDPLPPLELFKPNSTNTNPDPNRKGPEPMATSNGKSPQGESNATVLGHKLRNIGNTLGRVEAGVDDLGRLADSLAAQVREAYEFATQTGQIAATKQALDAANAVVQRLRALVAQASEAAVRAVEAVGSAVASLKTAENAEDSLRAQGGTGDAVATARAA